MIAGAEHCGPGGCKLRIAGVSKVFDGRRGKVVALEGIKLNIRGGEFVCLVGASGCGKTSLLNIIAGLEFPSSGVVELDGTGRVLIPRRMLDSIGIEGDEIVMVGQDSKIEIWGKIKYEESTMNTDEFVLLTSQIGL